MSEEEVKFRAYLLILNSEFPTHRKTEAMKELLKIFNKLQKENEHLRDIKNKVIEYIEENSFEDTTGVTLNLSDEKYWKVLKLLKGDDVE